MIVKVAKVGVVVPVHNRLEITLRFLESFANVMYDNMEIIIVDDGSTDGTSEAVSRRFPKVKIIRGDGTLWWAGATNIGIKYALDQGADFILTINDDVIADQSFLSELVLQSQNNPDTILGSRIMKGSNPEIVYSVGGNRCFSGGTFFTLNRHNQNWSEAENLTEAIIPVDIVGGRGTLFPRKVFDLVGFFDAKNFPQHCADYDFVCRAKAAGFKVAVATESILEDHGPENAHPKGLAALFNMKSPQHWRTTWLFLQRWGPAGKRYWLFFRQIASCICQEYRTRIHHETK